MNLLKSSSGPVQERENPGALTRHAFPIVGVGASAGGLEAISEFLRHIPEKTGLAFVFVQHLDPSHGSALTEILARSAHIPVEEVLEGTIVEPDHAYVIPPNMEMYIDGGILHLVPRQHRGVVSLPVDRFLCSLAADRQHRSIGVILSGTASDGAEGCRVIKEAGGIIFAQSEGSAKYSGMPQSAVNSGCVDFVLSPKEIAERLVQIGAHPYVARDLSQEQFFAYSERDLHDIFDIVLEQTGVDFSQYKPTTLQRRIQRRMALHKFGDLKDYIRYVKATPKEAEDLYRDILITVTNFFREPDAFEALKKTVFAPLLADRDPGASVRFWVPGCATGEEAYSIAMAFTEFFSEAGPKGKAVSFQIFASDVNEASLAKARLGIYSEAIVKDLTSERLDQFFVRQDGMYHVRKSIRETCIFARQNVAKDPPFSNLDLISCRNLLIYLGAALQTRVIPTFHYSLRPGGYLLLGGSETLGRFADQFAVVDKKHKIYQKKKDSPRLLTYFVNAGVTSPEIPTTRPSREQSTAQSLERQFDRVLLEGFGPSSIVVNEQMDIVHLRGSTSDYLEPPSGQPSFNLNKMARDGLLIDVRAAISSAKKLGKPVKRANLAIKSDRGLIRVDIEVCPFTPSGSREHYYIVRFHDHSSPAHKPSQSAEHSRLGGKGRRATSSRLRQELADTKEHLKTLIEDHETTLEESRSSNEEVLSTNEELQSLNEEMETAKEELQSTNEELRTVNEELQNRNYELITANDDLSNLFSNANIPLVMVSTDLIIRRFTPQAQSVLNLTAADVGRPISELHPNLRRAGLAEIAKQVVASATVHEEEVQANDGTWYLMRVRAYKTSDHHIAGAVFAFQDIDLMKRSLDESRSYTATLIESARESILILDSSLRVTTANNSFYKRFLVTPAETEGNFVYELGNGQWNLPQLRTLLEDILPARSRVDDFEVRADFPGIGQKVMYLNARRIESQRGTEAILLVVEDVTELKRSEQSLRDLSTRLLYIQEGERRQIARDLHDVTGQKIAALCLNVGVLSKQVPNAERNRTVIEIRELADQITNEIRSLSYVLHPPLLDQLGLVPALREYVQGVSDRTELQVALNVQERFPRLSDDIAMTIFRVIQECLTNVHRHSGSPDVTIDLRHIGNEIVVSVADSGRGLPPELALHAAEGSTVIAGVGIAGMRERVSHLGGMLQLSTGEKGATITARIPISESQG